MTPRKFIAFQERKFGRQFTAEETDCLNAARYACAGGKRETVKAMWVALVECIAISRDQQM
jgi:hypothetical protein